MNTTRLTTWAHIHQKCGLSERKFAILRRAIAEHSKCYISRIEREGHVWDDMLDSFIDGGIGIRFWGPGTKEIWSFPENNVEIRNFLHMTVWHSVKALSTGHRKPLGRPKKTPTIYQRGQPREQAVCPPKRPVRHSRKQMNYVETPDETPPHELERGRSPAAIVRLSSRPRAALIKLGIDSENESTATSPMGTCPEPVVPEKQLGFILETNRVGSSEITLIHSVHVPTLAHLVEKICKKDGLEEHQILGIDVKMGDRLFNVGLDDRRDWVYISKVIMESGLGAELVFWI